MKTRLLIIIIAVVVLSALSYIIIYQQSASQFILCDTKYDLVDGNCVKKASFDDPDYSIDNQEMVYENMSCNELGKKIYDEKISIDSKEIRKIVRERLKDCDDLIEDTVHNASCSSILIVAQTPLTFHVEDNRIDLEHAITKCVRDNKFELTDTRLTHQTSICNNDRYDEKDYVVNACKDVKVYSQPFKPSISFEELYPEIVENERKIIHEMDCSEFLKTYDGKMHTIGWSVHRVIITDYSAECKS